MNVRPTTPSGWRILAISLVPRTVTSWAIRPPGAWGETKRAESMGWWETAPVAELKHDAIGFRSALTMGVATPAPAYALATVLGLVVASAGVQAPAVLVAAFVPMLCVSAAFYFL